MTTATSTPETHAKTAQSVAFYTLGCKTNQLETSTLANDFMARGWQVVPFDESAHLYVVNTCTVTERADTESRRIIRRAKLSNPEAKIAVTGCYAQVAPEELAALDGVNYVIGNNFKDQIADFVETNIPLDKPLVKVSEIDKSRVMEGASRSGVANDGSSRTRGSLKIQDGCDYKCTYCIIWEARGLSRSLPVEDIKTQLARMTDPIWGEGFKEVMLTGINIGQYEAEYPVDANKADSDKAGQPCNLAGLLRELCAVPGDFRLRLTSLDPLEVTQELVDVVAESNGKICPHFHLSAQAAEDTVLKRMARRHHVADMLAICDYIAQKLPEASVGSDIIVGFPGETPELFEVTYQHLQNCNMNYFHVFSYSKRKGTPAATMEGQVPEREKKARAQRLRALSEAKDLAYRQRFIGKPLEVIVEESGLSGTSENYLKVEWDSPQIEANQKTQVRITEVTADQTLGELVLK